MTGPLPPATAASADIPPGHGRLRDRVVLVFGAGSAGAGWDIAKAAVFLASDEASYITGVCLPVDGGITCSVG